MPRFTDRALLLRRFPFGESSLVVQLATEHHGRVHLMAKGAYRPNSLFAVLDWYGTLELSWSSSPRRELGTLVQGDVLRRRKQISVSVARYRAASSIVELSGLAFRLDHRDPQLFQAAEEALDRLDRGDSVETTRVWFELRFLECAGLAPALELCASCGGPAASLGRKGRGPFAERVTFSAGAGGRLCAGCAREAAATGRRVGTLPLSVLETASKLLSGVEAGTQAVRAYDPELLERVRDFVERFLGYHLETRPRTHRSFLSVPNRNAP